MPEETVIAPPAPTPPPTPAPSPAPEPSGSDEMASLSFLKGDTESPKPADGKTAPAPKPADKPADKKVEPATKVDPKTVPPPQSKVEKDPVKLRERLAAIEKEYDGYKLTAKEEREKLQKEIAAYGQKKFLTPEQEQKQEALEKELKGLQAELYARDFRESPEFKQNFEAKWQSAATEAIQDISSLTVKSTDGESGEEKVRAATKGDFEQVLNAKNLVEARRVAKSLFGDDADIALQHRNKLMEIGKSMDSEVASRRAAYDTKLKESQGQQEANWKAYQTSRETITASLAETFPKHFGNDPENAEGVAEMNKGLEWFDEFERKGHELAPPQRAERAATVRMMVGGFRRAVADVKKRDATIAALNEELAKYRKSDPGAITDGPAPTPAPKDEYESTEDMAKAFGGKV